MVVATARALPLLLLLLLVAVAAAAAKKPMEAPPLPADLSAADAAAADDGVDIPRVRAVPPFTRTELAAVLGKRASELTFGDLMVLDMATRKLERALAKVAGDKLPSAAMRKKVLRRCVKTVESIRTRLYTKADAMRLDGAKSVLAPLEDAALQVANTHRLMGDASASLRAVYKADLVSYARGTKRTDDGKPQVFADVMALYKAMDGVGTTEATVFRVLNKRTTHEIKIIESFFARLCARAEPQLSARKCTLRAWLRREMSGGDYEKVSVMLRAQPVKDDSAYYWSTAAAKWWNGQLKASDAAAKRMIKGGNLALRGVGYLNQALFFATSSLNSVVKDAQEYWIARAQKASGFRKGVYMVMFVVATLPGSFGTKALDPTLPVKETEEGMFDLAITLGMMGAGKLVKVALKTRRGQKFVAATGRAFRAIRRKTYALKRLVGLGPRVGVLTRHAGKYERLAVASRTAGRSLRADRASYASHQYGEAARQLEKVRGLKQLRATEVAALEKATKLGRVDDVAAAQQRLIKMDAQLAEKLDKALDAHKAAKKYAFASNAVVNSAPVRALERVTKAIKNFFAKDIGRASRAFKNRFATYNRNMVGYIDDYARAARSGAREMSVKAMRKQLSALKKSGRSKRFATSHGGVTGSGVTDDLTLTQKQFWDKQDKVWRNGQGSLASSGDNVGTSIEGTIVDVGDTGRSFSPRAGSWTDKGGALQPGRATPEMMRKVKFDLADGKGVFDDGARKLRFDPNANKGRGVWRDALSGKRVEGAKKTPVWAEHMRWKPPKGAQYDDAAKAWVTKDGKRVRAVDGSFNEVAPAVDMCKVSPPMCQGPKGFYCQRFGGKFCKDMGGLVGRPRTQMPQFDMDNFDDSIRLLEKRLGRKVKVTKGTEVAPESLSLMQAEINLHKTASIGDGIARGGFKPPPTLAIRELDGTLTILDGHHRWSSFMWGKQFGGPAKMPVTIIDVPSQEMMPFIEEVYKHAAVNGHKFKHGGKTLIEFASL